MTKKKLWIIVAIVLVIIGALVIGLATGRNSESDEASVSWKEQYDLGVRYLSEGNYEEAIIAFTAAIEIDPKKPAAYEKLADVYIAMGDIDKAKDILEQGVEATGDDSLHQQLEKILNNSSSADVLTSEITTDENDVLVHRSNGWKHLYEYDEAGNLIRLEEYDENGISSGCWKFEYDDTGKLVREEYGYWRCHYGIDGALEERVWDISYSNIYFYENGNMVRYERIDDGDESPDEWYICNFYYSDNNKLIKAELYRDLYRYEYDSSGRLYRIEHYELHDEEDLEYSNVYIDEDDNIVSLREFEILYYAGEKLEKREIYTPPFFGDSDVLTDEFFYDDDGRCVLHNNYGDEWEEIYLAGYYEWEYSADTVIVLGYDDDGTQESQTTYKFDSMGLLESTTTTAEWLSEEEVEHNSTISSAYLIYNDAIYHGIDSLAFYFNSDSALHSVAMGSVSFGVRFGI